MLMNGMQGGFLKGFFLPWAVATVVGLIPGFMIPFFHISALVVFGIAALIVGLVQWALSSTGRPERRTIIIVSGISSTIVFSGAVLVVVGVDRDWPTHLLWGGAFLGSVFGLLHGALFVSVRSFLAASWAEGTEE
jgi:hypothetical protein